MKIQSNTEYPLTTARTDVDRHMRKAKRVRFDDAEMDGAPVYATPGGREAAQSPRCGAPKTSEYAYFRKIKNGGVPGHSRPLHKENEQLKRSKISYLIRETSSPPDQLKPSTKDLGFSVSGEMEGPSHHKLFLSPRIRKYDEPERMRRKEPTNKIKKRPLLLSESATPVGQNLFSSSLNEASENSENQCSEKGIFSAKRHRLRQWVARTSFSEVEKPHRKGFDLISLLLRRLLPKGTNNNDSSKGDADNSSKTLVLSNPNNLEKGLDLTQRYWDKDLPKISSDRSSENVVPQWDSFVLGFPSNYGKESHLQYGSVDHDLRSKGCKQHDYSVCFPFESYRSCGAFHFKDLDEFGSIIESGREEPHRLLLECDFELRKDRVDASTRNHDTEKNVCARLANSWNVDQQRIVDNRLYSKGFCSSPLSSTGCWLHNFGPNFDDVKCATAEPGHFSPALPCTPRCVTLAEDKTAEDILSDSNIVFPYRNEHWLKQVWNGNAQSKFWWKCLSAVDFSVEEHQSVFHACPFPENGSSSYSLSRLKEAPGEPFTPFSEAAFNHYSFSSSSALQSFLDTPIKHPLLLDHVSQDSPGQELYFDDCDNYLGYKDIL